MGLDLFASGLVDDLACDAVVVDVRRVGESMYTLGVSGPEALLLEVWTTRKDLILATSSDAQPAWLRLTVGARGELESFSASNCHLHFEHLDRNRYMLAVSRGAEYWEMHLHAHGYVKTRVVEGPDPSPRS